MTVTNDHVVEKSTHVLVRFGANAAAIDGDVLGTDPSSDLAVIAIDPARLPRDANPSNSPTAAPCKSATPQSPSARSNRPH